MSDFDLSKITGREPPLATDDDKDAEIESLRSRLAEAQDSANTWHTRAEVHRQAAENAERALAEVEAAWDAQQDERSGLYKRLAEADALLREARTVGAMQIPYWLDRIDAHLSRKADSAEGAQK